MFQEVIDAQFALWKKQQRFFSCVLGFYSQGPLLLALINIPAWISNRMSSKVRGEITYPSLNSKGAAMKFGNR